MCEFIEKNKEEFNKKNVIELGAGSGLVGIVAALIGMFFQAALSNSGMKALGYYRLYFVWQNSITSKSRVS